MSARAFWLTLLATALGGVLTLVIYDRYIKQLVLPRAPVYPIR
jgi:hypothetical protein